MTKAFLKEMEDILLKEKERLESELKQISDQNPKNKADYDVRFVNMGDKEDENAEEVATYSTNLTLERTLERTLRDVNSALDRIKKGSYGVCKYCGKDIPENRLKARPESSSHVDCKKNLTNEF